LEAGSRAGRTEQVLQTLSQDLTEQSQHHLYRVIHKIEPALVAISCVFIGLILFSVMLPLMDIMNAIG
jgi:type IV pilus assembly protein PilC